MSHGTFSDQDEGLHPAHGLPEGERHRRLSPARVLLADPRRSVGAGRRLPRARMRFDEPAHHCVEIERVSALEKR